MTRHVLEGEGVVALRHDGERRLLDFVHLRLVAFEVEESKEGARGGMGVPADVAPASRATDEFTEPLHASMLKGEDSHELLLVHGHRRNNLLELEKDGKVEGGLLGDKGEVELGHGPTRLKKCRVTDGVGGVDPLTVQDVDDVPLDLGR